MDLQTPPSLVGGSLIDKAPYLFLILLVILSALYQQSQITKKNNKPDSAQAKQMQTIGKVMPLFFGFISWSLPTGLVLYFLTGNIFRIGQQALIVNLDNKEENKNEEVGKKEEKDPNKNNSTTESESKKFIVKKKNQ